VGQECYISEDLEGSARSQYEDMIQNLAGRLNKTTEISVLAISKLVRIRSRKFPKTNLGFVSALTRSVARVNAINARGAV
jgi:hypothetical protein